MNATDRTDAPIGESLVRAPSHQIHDFLQASSSHHAHFDLPADSEESISQHQPVIDIEHVPVDDDPREWSAHKKSFVMALMTVAVLGPMISPSIYNPVIDEVKSDLNGTETQVGLSLSIYILFQGCVPVVWASTAEIIGRKPIYIASFIIYTIGSAVGSRATTMGLLIGMRCLQAMGSSAVLAVGAGSLADMYETHERGRKLGLYYGMPMMGPALGPLIGGALGNAFGWRSTMYFLAVFAGIMTLAFLAFPDTWRRERSRVYQKAVGDALKRALKHEAQLERKRQRKLAKGIASTAETPATTNPGTPHSGTRTPVTRRGSIDDGEIELDAERGGEIVTRRRRWWPFRPRTADNDEPEQIKPSIRDVNPVPTMISIFKRPTNAVVLICSGLLFAAQYTTTYTASITFAAAPYDYNALIIGVVLLAFGVGNIVGSVFGGRFSDWTLRKMKEANGGVSVPEMRLKSTLAGMPFMVVSYLIYAWTAEFKTSIAGPVVGLFFAGLSLMFVYSSTLAYLVDANPGRSASAVSCNSFCRGLSACVMSQAAIPIKNAIGDGGLYTLFAGLLCLSSAGLITIAYKGESWRSPDHRWPWTSQSVTELELSEKQPESAGASASSQTTVKSLDEN